MTTIVLRGGRVIDPAQNLDAETDLWLSEGRIVGIDVLDHLIIGNGTVVSLRERGAL